MGKLTSSNLHFSCFWPSRAHQASPESSRALSFFWRDTWHTFLGALKRWTLYLKRFSLSGCLKKMSSNLWLTGTKLFFKMPSQIRFQVNKMKSKCYFQLEQLINWKIHVFRKQVELMPLIRRLRTFSLILKCGSPEAQEDLWKSTPLDVPSFVHLPISLSSPR